MLNKNLNPDVKKIEIREGEEIYVEACRRVLEEFLDNGLKVTPQVREAYNNFKSYNSPIMQQNFFRGIYSQIVSLESSGILD